MDSNILSIFHTKELVFSVLKNGLLQNFLKATVFQLRGAENIFYYGQSLLHSFLVHDVFLVFSETLLDFVLCIPSLMISVFTPCKAKVVTTCVLVFSEAA